MEASENEEEAGEFEDDREELVPSYDEVYEALEELRNNKAAGSDGLPGELLKSALKKKKSRLSVSYTHLDVYKRQPP